MTTQSNLFDSEMEALIKKYTEGEKRAQEKLNRLAEDKAEMRYQLEVLEEELADQKRAIRDLVAARLDMQEALCHLRRMREIPF